MFWAIVFNLIMIGITGGWWILIMLIALFVKLMRG